MGLQDFLAQLSESISANTFVKITMSKAYPKNADLQNIYIRKIKIKGDSFLSFTYRYQTQDIEVV